MLIRREIENYLFDKEIFKKAFPNTSDPDYDNIVSDICTEDIKSKIPKLLQLIGKKGKITNNEACLMLAKLITPETAVYQ
jgi:hypothetical protein